MGSGQLERNRKGESEEVGGRSVKVAVGGFDDVRGVNKIYKTNPFSYFAKGVVLTQLSLFLSNLIMVGDQAVLVVA